MEEGTRREPAEAPEPLVYGVEPRAKQWRWRAKLLLAVLLLFAAVWSVDRIVAAFREHSAHLRAQAALFRQVLPAGTVIYTEDSKRIEALRGQGGYRDARKSKSHGAQDVAVMPEAWERVEQRGWLEGRDHGSAEVRMFQIDDTFNHLRTSKGGVRWIVGIGSGGPFATPSGRRTVGITYGTISLAGWKPGDRGVHYSTSVDMVLLGRSDVFTLFAPQPDPNDASVVMVPYELNGQAGVLDAKVSDDGVLTYTVRTGPARLAHPGRD